MIPNPDKNQTYTYEALLVDPDGRFTLSRGFDDHGTLNTYLSAGLPGAARYAIPLRRRASSIEWRAEGGAWIAARSVFDVPRPNIAAFRPRRATFARRAA